MALCVLPALLFCLSWTSVDAELGFANGIKIGEVRPDSAVLWTRLTQHDEAMHRVVEWDPEQPHWQVPGASGEVRFAYRRDGDEVPWAFTSWQGVQAGADFCHQVQISGLEAGMRYSVEAQGRAHSDAPIRVRFPGAFTTAPASDDSLAVTFTVSTCQDFPRRDDPAGGHLIYRSMLASQPRFFVQTGDTLYYDKPKPLAKDIATARYKWNRMYALPHQRAFHAQVPSYWMHDDLPDGPDNSILGEEQWAWLEDSLEASAATFKVYISSTPVVGPDRPKKNDNHANAGLAYEGNTRCQEQPACQPTASRRAVQEKAARMKMERTLAISS